MENRSETYCNRSVDPSGCKCCVRDSVKQRAQGNAADRQPARTALATLPFFQPKTRTAPRGG
jgi:hypothetical protein